VPIHELTIEWDEAETVVTMTDLTKLLQDLGQLAHQHLPRPWVDQGVPVAIFVLLAGLGISFFGARLARFAITAGFVVLGGAAGVYFARHMDWSPVLCMAPGAAMLGTIAHFTFRLWVGVVSAIALAFLALSFFGYHRVAPHAAEFSRTALTTVPDEPATFSLPTPAEQAVYHQRSPRQWAGEMWTYVIGKDPQVERSAHAVALVALVTGLFFGVIAVRATLILSTSVLGTVFSAVALATLLARFLPSTYQALLQRPQIAGIGLAVFLVGSLSLQALFTRKWAAAKGQQSANP